MLSVHVTLARECGIKAVNIGSRVMVSSGRGCAYSARGPDSGHAGRSTQDSKPLCRLHPVARWRCDARAAKEEHYLRSRGKCAEKRVPKLAVVPDERVTFMHKKRARLVASFLLLNGGAPDHHSSTATMRQG